MAKAIEAGRHRRAPCLRRPTQQVQAQCSMYKHLTLARRPTQVPYVLPSTPALSHHKIVFQSIQANCSSSFVRVLGEQNLMLLRPRLCDSATYYVSVTGYPPTTFPEQMRFICTSTHLGGLQFDSLRCSDVVPSCEVSHI